MSILIGRYAGHVTITSTSTGGMAAASEEEWQQFVARIKSGHLDHTLKPSKADTRAMPNGTERPGEHWNARLIRESAEAERVE